MKRLLSILFAFPAFLSIYAAEPDFSVPFAEYDQLKLELDVYMPLDSLQEHYCVVFAFGGRFANRNQRQSRVKEFCRRLANDGYVAVAMDYRLGMEGVSVKGHLKMIDPLDNAVHIATEDMLLSVSHVLQHAGEWKIRPDGIILCGSSAGAITSLQADYELCNRTEISSVLPEDFRFAGVVSFSGAIFSRKGICAYPFHEPAPTLFLHGMDDKTVPYDNISIFNVRFSGSSDLAKVFKKNGWPYEIIRYKGQKHSVANSMLENYDDMIWFINHFVKSGRKMQVDKTVSDFGHKAPSWDK